MDWLHKLVKAGDSTMVTIPMPIVKRWRKAGVSAVVITLTQDGLLITPQVLVERRYQPAHLTLKEDPHADR